MPIELRLPMRDTRRIDPHVLQVRERRAGLGRRVVQSAVEVRPDPGEQILRRLAPRVPGPALADLGQVPGTSAAGDDDVFGAGLERADGALSAHAGDGPAFDDQLVHPVVAVEVDAPTLELANPAQRGGHQAGAAPPQQVESRDAVAPAVLGALGPVGDRHETEALCCQPLAHVRDAALDILSGPSDLVDVLGFELGVALPVRPGEVERVADADPALFGAADEEDSAERVAALAAQPFTRPSLVDRDPPALRGDFGGGDQRADAATGDENVHG